MHRSANRAFGCLVSAAMLLALVPAAAARAGDGLDWDPGSAAVQRFTSARWSMIVPARDFEGGCVAGFMAFEFSPTGYFVFNNSIRGSWRLDELGNIKLKTRDGTRMTLIVQDTTLRPARSLAFLRRSEVYQLCAH